MVSGALLIDKPIGVTSSGVVTQLKWAMQNNDYVPKGFRIGHGGTLDPFATGVLVVLFGEGTKLADAYLHSVKAYDGLIQLGAQTDTGDPTGSIIEEKSAPLLIADQWNDLAQTFVTMDYLQVPPMYSAKKKDGVALYTLARAGKTIEREAILKKISKFEIQLETESSLRFEAHCESGTYIRVLAEDLAKRAGTLAHLKSLRRIRSSDFSLQDCASLPATLSHFKEKKPLGELPSFRELNKLASHLPQIELGEVQALRLRQGVKAEAETQSGLLLEMHCQSRYALGKKEGQAIALFEKESDFNRFRLQRVFN
ncbi:MAG: tRNA pseudouridine(55) synthase TruB [Bdellovibrionales bacterium]|nr:tRNA pseudouridine(55) synthase TruB [Oligoflexia bacterium]